MGKWEPDENVFTDYVGTVIGAEFTRNKFGRVELVLQNETDNPKTPEWTERYSIGDKWEVMNGGREIVSSEGKEAFDGKSNIGQFQKALIKAVGSVDELESWGDPFEVETYMGLRLHYSSKKGNFKKDGENISFSRNYPDTFEGKADIPWKAPTRRDAEDDGSERQGYSNDAELAPGPLMAKVKAMAQLADYDDWRNSVLDLTVGEYRALDYGRLLKGLETKDLYNELKGS